MTCKRGNRIADDHHPERNRDSTRFNTPCIKKRRQAGRGPLSEKVALRRSLASAHHPRPDIGQRATPVELCCLGPLPDRPAPSQPPSGPRGAPCTCQTPSGRWSVMTGCQCGCLVVLIAEQSSTACSSEQGSRGEEVLRERPGSSDPHAPGSPIPRARSRARGRGRARGCLVPQRRHELGQRLAHVVTDLARETESAQPRSRRPSKAPAPCALPTLGKESAKRAAPQAPTAAAGFETVIEDLDVPCSEA